MAKILPFQGTGALVAELDEFFDKVSEAVLVQKTTFLDYMESHDAGPLDGRVEQIRAIEERADELDLPLMTDRNTDPFRTAFTISVDADQRFGVTTGVSAHDRAKTIEVLADEVGVARSVREAPEIDGVVHVGQDVVVGEFSTVEIVDALGPDLVAAGGVADEVVT